MCDVLVGLHFCLKNLCFWTGWALQVSKYVQVFAYLGNFQLGLDQRQSLALFLAAEVIIPLLSEHRLFAIVLT